MPESFGAKSSLIHSYLNKTRSQRPNSVWSLHPIFGSLQLRLIISFAVRSDKRTMAVVSPLDRGQTCFRVPSAP